MDAVRAFWQDEVRGHYEGGDDCEQNNLPRKRAGAGPLTPLSDVFDLDLGEEPYNPTIIDFAPYRESTDPLLFSYEELRGLLAASRRGELAAAAEAASTRTPPPAGEDAPTADMAGATAESQSTVPRLPVFKVVDSASHPSASRAAPAFSTNMVPLEMLQMSEGRTLADFAREWQEAMANDGEASDSDESDDDEEDNGNGNGNAGANINADEVD